MAEGRDEALRSLRQSNKSSFQKARDRGDLPGRGNGHKVFFTTDQWEAILQAVKVMRKTEGDMTEAQALELMAAEYFAGAQSEEQEG